MLRLLWTCFYDNDIDGFRQILESGLPNGRRASHNHKSLVTSPQISAVFSRYDVARERVPVNRGGANQRLTKEAINYKDKFGLTLLHRIASTASPNPHVFAKLLIENSPIDLYAQDYENGWTALHRAFYFGNIRVALAILQRETGVPAIRLAGNQQTPAAGLIKIKDLDGLGPLDLYAASVSNRHADMGVSPPHATIASDPENDRDSDDDEVQYNTNMDQDETRNRQTIANAFDLDGDDCFMFGSNRNATLGFADEDDRARPERVQVRRPNDVVEQQYQALPSGPTLDQTKGIPWSIKGKTVIIQDVRMSKLHTAVLTTDDKSNLYICGHGPGGRLGLGHVRTQFSLACVQGGFLTDRKVACVALGQDHTLALSDAGEIASWGSNFFGQLGYALPSSGLKDSTPVQTLPRQIYGVLKRETLCGIAASRIHSVAFTTTSLYVWGKNDGQLGIVDADARSLDCQLVPRKVGASLFRSTIKTVSVSERATVCLLASCECWVLTNYGYVSLSLALPTDFNDTSIRLNLGPPERIHNVIASGDSLCASSDSGNIYTWTVASTQSVPANISSTTNPAKIKGALSPAQRVWSPRTLAMGARDMVLDEDGTLLVTARDGSLWQRTRRVKALDSNHARKARDYKFTRISGLANIVAVRASGHGSYAAIRRDADVMRTSIDIKKMSLSEDMFPLSPLARLLDNERIDLEPRLWRALPTKMELLKRIMLVSEELEQRVLALDFDRADADGYDVILTTPSTNVRLPVHSYILSARSTVLADVFSALRAGKPCSLPARLDCSLDSSSVFTFTCDDVDVLTMLNLALYCYTDEVVDYWNHIGTAISFAPQYRQIRSELMKIAGALGMQSLESAVRQMIAPERTIHTDFANRMNHSQFIEDADTVVELADGEVAVHQRILCRRCPFLDALFNTAGGMWLEGRRATNASIKVDLKHVEKSVFDIVLQHLYTDAGPEMFDTLEASNEDEMLGILLDVLAVADELMITRLSQICQHALGLRVNVRNIVPLMNVIGPCSEPGFKDAGLRYLCLVLEEGIHSRIFADLDDYLFEQLETTVRGRQTMKAGFLPVHRVRDSDLEDMTRRERTERLIALDAHSRLLDAKPSERSQSAKQVGHSPLPSPSVIPQRSPHMSVPSMQPYRDKWTNGAYSSLEDTFNIGSPASLPSNAIDDATPRIKVAPPGRSSTTPSKGKASVEEPSVCEEDPSPTPWRSGSRSGVVEKLDMKAIMTQTSASKVSNISLGLAATQRENDNVQTPVRHGKVSQKDRKRSQQQQVQQVASPVPSTPASAISAKSGVAGGSPWQVTPTQRIPSLKDVMTKESKPVQTGEMTNGGSSETVARPLNMRQTIANQKPQATPAKPSISPVPMTIRPATEARKVSGPHSGALSLSPSGPFSSTNIRPAARFSSAEFPSISTVSKSPGAVVEPTLQLSMTDIVALQQREKEIIKEAAAKRSLQEIQQEQEFAEWWAKEERKYQGMDDSGVADQVVQVGGGKTAAGNEKETSKRRRPGRKARESNAVKGQTVAGSEAGPVKQGAKGQAGGPPRRPVGNET